MDPVYFLGNVVKNLSNIDMKQVDDTWYHLYNHRQRKIIDPPPASRATEGHILRAFHDSYLQMDCFNKSLHLHQLALTFKEMIKNLYQTQTMFSYTRTLQCRADAPHVQLSHVLVENYMKRVWNIVYIINVKSKCYAKIL